MNVERKKNCSRSWTLGYFDFERKKMRISKRNQKGKSLSRRRMRKWYPWGLGNNTLRRKERSKVSIYWQAKYNDWELTLGYIPKEIPFEKCGSKLVSRGKTRRVRGNGSWHWPGQTGYGVGNAAGREAKGKEPQEVVKPWAKYFQPGKCPIGRPCPHLLYVSKISSEPV